MANNQDTLRETQQLNQALEETRWKMSQLGSDTVRVQNDVSNAMSRVTGQLRQLGNTMVPVANVGLNLFSRLLRVLQPLAEGVASFVSTLFGLRLSGTVRSLNRASSALSKTGKSAKSAAKATKALAKAQRDLMSFDQINKLSDRKNRTSGGGYKSTGGGKGKGSGSGLGGLRGMKIGVSQWALKVRKVLADIWKPFRKAWKTHGETVMKSFQNAMGKIGKLVKSVGSTWLSIWKSKAGEKIVGAVLKIVSKVCDVAGTLAERFRIAWESCGNGERIVNAVYGILEDALEWVGRLADSTAQWAQNLDFGPALESLGGLLESFRNLADVAEDRLADAYENVLLPLAQWAIQDGGPKFMDNLAKAMDALSDILDRIQPKTDKLEGFFKTDWKVNAAIELVKNGWTTVAAWVSGAAGGLVSKVIGLSKTWSTVKEWVNDHTGGAVRKLVSLVKNGWSSVAAWVGSARTSVKAKIGLVKSGWRTLAGFIGSFKKNIRLKLTWVTSGLSSFKKTVARILFGSAKWPTLQFAARGGVVNGATLFGSTVVGEAGREAIVPLEHNTEWLDLVAERVAQQVSRDRPIVVQCVLDGKVIANSTVNYINRQARATGVNPLSATI